mmetsp:Transcript_14131/g.38399  ORF Transcript_14131/g.38399 Transcript_14131/m.38399 type:complete len:624 (+) Transcript_14131:40-1911(+)
MVTQPAVGVQRQTTPLTYRVKDDSDQQQHRREPSRDLARGPIISRDLDRQRHGGYPSLQPPPQHMDGLAGLDPGVAPVPGLVKTALDSSMETYASTSRSASLSRSMLEAPEVSSPTSKAMQPAPPEAVWHIPKLELQGVQSLEFPVEGQHAQAAATAASLTSSPLLECRPHLEGLSATAGHYVSPRGLADIAGLGWRFPAWSVASSTDPPTIPAASPALSTRSLRSPVLQGGRSPQGSGEVTFEVSAHNTKVVGQCMSARATVPNTRPASRPAVQASSIQRLVTQPRIPQVAPYTGFHRPVSPVPLRPGRSSTPAQCRPSPSAACSVDASAADQFSARRHEVLSLQASPRTTSPRRIARGSLATVLPQFQEGLLDISGPGWMDPAFGSCQSRRGSLTTPRTTTPAPARRASQSAVGVQGAPAAVPCTLGHAVPPAIPPATISSTPMRQRPSHPAAVPCRAEAAPSCRPQRATLPHKISSTPLLSTQAAMQMAPVPPQAATAASVQWGGASLGASVAHMPNAGPVASGPTAFMTAMTPAPSVMPSPRLSPRPSPRLSPRRVSLAAPQLKSPVLLGRATMAPSPFVFSAQVPPWASDSGRSKIGVEEQTCTSGVDVWTDTNVREI